MNDKTITDRSGWTYNGFGKCWIKGKRKIFELPTINEFVISWSECWLPGSFDSFETAEKAFDLNNAALSALQTMANARAGGEGGTITAKDVQNV